MPHPSSYYTQHLHHYLKSLLLPIPCLDPDITTLKTPTAPEYTLVLDSPHSPTEARVTVRSGELGPQTGLKNTVRSQKYCPVLSSKMETVKKTGPYGPASPDCSPVRSLKNWDRTVRSSLRSD